MIGDERLATAPGERVASIDVLRGFALLGILVMNVQAFSMPMAAYANPYAWGDLSGLNYPVWLGSHLLFDSKFIAIFSMLFGAGIAMGATREASRGKAVYFRRYTVLLVIGFVHAYFIWYGDVLAYYAICAFILYYLRERRTITLLTAAIACYALTALLFLLLALTTPYWPADQLEAVRLQYAPEPHELEPEIATMQGGFWGIFMHRLPFMLKMHFIAFPVFFMPALLGLMLLGMVLHRLGALQAHWPGIRYAALAAIALLVGVPIAYAGVRYIDTTEWTASVKFYGALYNYWAAPIIALGWIGFVMLWCQSGRAPGLQYALSCVGRMALTNYLLQSLIGVFVFYGFGLGWFAQVERTGQVVFVLCVWAFQLVLSPLWLRYFQYGPMEWLWRSITYRQKQPMRKAA